MNKIIIFLSLITLLNSNIYSQNDKITGHDAVFLRYLTTNDKSLAESIIKSDDGLYSIFCKGVLSNDMKEKVKYFTDFITLKPKYGLERAYISRGLAFTGQERYELAIEDYSSSINLNNKDAYSFYFRGAAYQSLDKLDKSIEDLTTSIKLDSNFALAYYLRGICYLDTKEHNKSLADFKQALKIDSTMDLVYLMRGLVYEELNDLNSAIADWKESVRLNPSNAKHADKKIESATKKLNANK